MQHDINGDHEFVAVMIAGAVHNRRMKCLGYFLAKVSRKIWKHSVSGGRHDQIDASSVLRADCAIQIDVFTNELGGDLRPDADGSPARSLAVHPAEARFIGKHDIANRRPRLGGSPPGFPHSALWKIVFLKEFAEPRCCRLG